MSARSLILGLDASARRIGWALIDYDSGQLIVIGCEHTPADDDLRTRRAAVKEIAAHAYGRGDVCAVFVEDAYVGPSRAGTIQHAAAVGNVEAFALERWPQQLVARIAAARWRSLLGIAAHGKQPVIEWAHKHADRAMWTQDEADAFAIACAGHCLLWQAGGTTASPYFTTTLKGKEAV